MKKFPKPKAGKRPRAAGIALAACLAALFAMAGPGCTMLVEEWDVPELQLLELDREFGTSGEARFVTADTNEFAYAGAVQSDGKIVVAGRVWNGSNHDIQVVRFNGNGSVDTAFGTGGTFIRDISGNDSARAVVLQSNGKIVVAGVSGEGNAATSMVAIRLNADGTADTDFDTDGIVVTDTPGTYDEVRSIAAQDDGTILVGGSAYFDTTYYRDFIVVRYESNGAIDTAFGSSGFARAQFADSPNGGDMAVQDDGKIVIAGKSGTAGKIARFNAGGSLDTGFGSSGMVTDTMSTATAMCLDDSGRIVIAGTAGEQIAVSRYTGAGDPDAAFGTGGTVLIDVNTVSINDIHAQDGKITFLDRYYQLCRINHDGSVDGSFHASDDEVSQYPYGQNQLYSQHPFSVRIEFGTIYYSEESTFFLRHGEKGIVIGGHADMSNNAGDEFFFLLGRILLP